MHYAGLKSTAGSVNWYHNAGYKGGPSTHSRPNSECISAYSTPNFAIGGSVDSPDVTPFNGDPEKLKKTIKNPERIVVLAPGQPFTLSKLKPSQKK